MGEKKREREIERNNDKEKNSSKHVRYVDLEHKHYINDMKHEEE